MKFYFSWMLIFLLAGVCEGQSLANSHEEILLPKALQFYQKNDLAGCIKSFSELVRINPRKGLYWFDLGNCLFMAGQYSKAQSAYGNVLKLKSPLSPAAQLYQARVLVKQGRTSEAQTLLKDLKAQSLPPSLRTELALELYQQSMFAEVEEQIEKAPSTEDSKTQLLLGLSLVKQNKTAEAEKVLNALSAAGDLSAQDRAVVRDLLVVLKTPSGAEKPSWIFLDLAYGSTSNAYLEGRSYAPVSSSLLRASFGGGYRFWQNPSWDQKVSYVFDYESPGGAPELTTQIHAVQVPLVFRGRLMEAGLVPYVQAQIWDTSMSSQKIGMLIRSSTLGKDLGGGFDVDLASQKGIGDSYSYLSGSFYSIRPFVSWSRGDLTGQAYWLLGVDGTQDIVYSDGSRLPLLNNYQGPGLRVLWRTTVQSSVLVQLLYLERTYKNNSLPEDKHRQDQELSSSVKYVYAFSPALVGYILTEYNPNKSTLGSGDVRDKNYDNLNLLAGVGWDVF